RLFVTDDVGVSPPRIAFRIFHVYGEVDGNRLTPVALARKYPVAKLVVDLSLPPALFDQAIGDFRFGLEGWNAGKRIPVKGQPFGGVGSGEIVVGLAVGADHLDEGQLVALGEFEIALVVRGDGHHRAGAVRGEDVIGDPYWEARAGQRMNGERSRVDAGLDLRELGAVELALARRFFDVLGDEGALGKGSEFAHQRMLGREHHVRASVERVRSRRENAQASVVSLDGEVDFGAFATPD